MITSHNPATNQPIASIPATTNEDISRKIKAAHSAKHAWKAFGANQRVELLRPLVQALQNNERDLINLTVQETGKTITEATEDFSGDIYYLEAFLNDGPGYLADEITVKEGATLHKIVYEPRGVVAAIVPWNFPLTNFLWAVIPNLIAGNTVVFKHSEECPLMGKRLEDIFQELVPLPPGVLSFVHGGPIVGSELAQQPVDMLWFIGSSRVGHEIGQLAGQKNIKCILEMGGSNPVIVFPDVDIDDAVQRIYRGRFSNCGQVCDAIKRAIVHHDIFDEFVAKMAAHLEQIVVGEPTNPASQLGPLVAQRQLDLLELQISEAVNAGATIVTGGKRPANLDGAYCLPTLITNINTAMRVWREEVFGPVLPVIAFHTKEEAIYLANDTPYGLGAAVYSKDLTLARSVANEIEAGFVDINQGSHWRPCNPFGGVKASGMGVEHGRAGFQDLCRIKVIAE